MAINQEKAGTTGQKGCEGHMADKEESIELQELVTEQMDQSELVYSSPVDNGQEIKWDEERDMPPIQQLSVDDHLTINQRISESESSYHCTASTSENGKKNANNNLSKHKHSKSCYVCRMP